MAMEKAKANRDITNGEMREQITKHLKRREQNRKEFLAKHLNQYMKISNTLTLMPLLRRLALG